ncbi:MAG: RNA polymerase factor sigma-54 [Prevotellaceae bacterium]|jgi:RNA polymerase sigma-54 factor|nr:RNA polymerase factor sigma-54 [Prevotellaceae bacterium]
MLKQSLQQKLLQKLSPLQIQMIKLLELPTMQLEQRIKKELEENPVLEETANEEDLPKQETDNSEDIGAGDNEFSSEDYMGDNDEIPSYKLKINNHSADDKREYSVVSYGPSFQQMLDEQLGFRYLNDCEHELGLFIIGSIDDDGYLRRDLESIADDIAFKLNIETTKEELEQILEVIQGFDPPGVGARNLQECLLLQIKTRNRDLESVQIAEDILNQCFDEFTKKHYDKITARLGISEDMLRDAINEILKLNPKPGGGFNDGFIEQVQQIIPDFILEIKDGELQLNLTSYNIPELKVNREYSQILDNYANKQRDVSQQERDAVTFVKQKVDSAKWFIDAIKQRQNTLLMTMNAIVNFQREYFLTGDETKLRPMILKDIADITGLDISTISRVVNSKYIQTYFGIFPLKFFFSEGMVTDSGEEVSTREIKKILSECVNKENKHKPLTDEQLMEVLNEKGYPIARRTIAKYREQLNIPVARLRKEL